MIQAPSRATYGAWLVTVVAVLFLFPFCLLAQTNYDARNFSTTHGYVRGVGIVSTSQPTAIRWQGNDLYNAASDTGETDLVARVSGYTPNPIQNSSLIQGGLGVAAFPQVLPGTNNVRIWKTFAPTPSSSFFVEWSLIPSLEGAPYDRSDTFAFDLRNAANTASLLRLQLTPGISIQPDSYTLQVIAAGSATQTVIDLGYQSLFQMQVGLSGSSWNLSLARINSSTRTNIATYTNLASGALADQTTAADFATIGLDWNLASGNPTEPGSNYIIANQFTVVPEPSTWALLASAGILLALGALRRRSA